MSKPAINRFAAFAKPPIAAETSAPVVTIAPPAIEQTPAVKPKRGPGRPKKEVKTEVQTTTIRLDPDDHLAVRTLALRDKMKMNELVFVALKDYCQKRGIKLHGASTNY